MLYLLDTNICSHIMRNNPIVVQNLQNQRPENIVISRISYAELRFGLAYNPKATRLHKAFDELLAQIHIAEFNQEVADHYAIFRAQIQKSGKNLFPLDMMIAAHAHHLGAILVTNDQAFFKIDGLQVQDWTK